MIIADSKKILKYALDQAISDGNLAAGSYIRYDTLAKELRLESEGYCRVCCQYLNELHYIHILTNDNGNRKIRLTAKGIDFLESM